MTRSSLHLEYANNVSSDVTDAPLTAVATTINVSDGTGFAPTTANRRVAATLDDGTNIEIVYISAVATNALTVVRGQEGTTGTEFTAGTTLRVSVTAGLLEQLDAYSEQSGSSEGSVSLGKSANVGTSAGANQVALGRGATADHSEGSNIAIGDGADASAGGSIAIGKSAFSSGSGESLSIGFQAEADSLRSVHIGYGNGTTNGARGDYAVVIGPSSSVGVRGVCIGYSNTANTGTDAVVIGYSHSLVSLPNMSVVIGNDSIITSSDDCIAVGSTVAIDSASNNSIAIGKTTAIDEAAGSIAIGFAAKAGTGFGGQADDSIALGTSAWAFGIESAAVGLNVRTFAEGAFRPYGPHIVQRASDSFVHQGQPNTLLGQMTIIASPPCDLGPGVAWSTATFNDGEVIEPATPVGTEQFYLAISSVAITNYNPAIATTNSITETSTEPTFVKTTQGDTTATNFSADDEWVYVDPEAGIDVAVDNISSSGGGQVIFYPTRAAFICQKFTAMTAEPFVSVGNQTSATAYVNNQQLTSITAADTTQWFDIADPDGATNIVFTLETRGTISGTCQGRFIVQGFYMQKMG